MKYKYESLHIMTSDGKEYEFDDSAIIQFDDRLIRVEDGPTSWAFFQNQVCCAISVGEQLVKE